MEIGSGMIENKDENKFVSNVEPEEILISKKETKQLMKSAMLAAYAVGGIMILIFFLFILFCIYIWF
jgi:preprotein translocase subunit SecF